MWRKVIFYSYLLGVFILFARSKARDPKNITPPFIPIVDLSLILQSKTADAGPAGSST